jgi:hypothetical protein
MIGQFVSHRQTGNAAADNEEVGNLSHGPRLTPSQSNLLKETESYFEIIQEHSLRFYKSGDMACRAAAVCWPPEIVRGERHAPGLVVDLGLERMILGDGASAIMPRL